MRFQKLLKKESFDNKLPMAWYVNLVCKEMQT